MVDPANAEFHDAVDPDDLQELATNPQFKSLQCSAPVRDSVWPMLNDCFFAFRPDVALRVYGHYSTVCDLGFARQMRSVRHFAADCLMHAKNVEAIAEIPHLESLSLGIYDLDSFRVLELLPPTLTEMYLGATRSKKPDLKPLSRFSMLKNLYIEGHTKNIESLGELMCLERLTLRSITTSDLSYLSDLPALWSLDIKLGGIRSFVGIHGKDSIKHLELWQIRELGDVTFVSDLPGLQYLFLQSLPHIESFPSLVNAQVLRRVVIENLKSLSDFSAFETAPALEEFALIQGYKQMPEQLLPVLRNPSVRQARGGFGSHRKNNTFLRLLKEHGKADWTTVKPFEFH